MDTRTKLEGWQSIETIPQDGTPVLVHWTAHGGHQVVEAYQGCKPCPNCCQPYKGRPTHWHSLPADPGGER